MFNLINIGERSGSGIPMIYSVWKKEGWPEPEIEESFNPDRSTLRLRLPGIQTAVKSVDKKAKRKVIWQNHGAAGDNQPIFGEACLHIFCGAFQAPGFGGHASPQDPPRYGGRWIFDCGGKQPQSQIQGEIKAVRPPPARRRGTPIVGRSLPGAPLRPIHKNP